MKIPLVVTTAHRGVFFGYGEPSGTNTIHLEWARMCIMWTEENHDVLGLATDGPKNGARIGPACPGLTLRDVTAIAECTAEAVKAWESNLANGAPLPEVAK